MLFRSGTFWEVDDNIVIFAAGWLFDKGLLQDGAVDAQNVVVIDEFDLRRRDDLSWVNRVYGDAGHLLDMLDHFGSQDLRATVTRHFQAFRRAHVDVIEQSEADAPIPEGFLHRDIVDTEWLPSLDIGNGLFQGKTIRIERN